MKHIEYIASIIITFCTIQLLSIVIIPFEAITLTPFIPAISKSLFASQDSYNQNVVVLELQDDAWGEFSQNKREIIEHILDYRPESIFINASFDDTEFVSFLDSQNIEYINESVGITPIEYNQYGVYVNEDTCLVCRLEHENANKLETIHRLPLQDSRVYYSHSQTDLLPLVLPYDDIVSQSNRVDGVLKGSHIIIGPRTPISFVQEGKVQNISTTYLYGVFLQMDNKGVSTRIITVSPLVHVSIIIALGVVSLLIYYVRFPRRVFWWVTVVIGCVLCGFSILFAISWPSSFVFNLISYVLLQFIITYIDWIKKTYEYTTQFLDRYRPRLAQHDAVLSVKPMIVMFTDLRGFTQWSEREDPVNVHNALNRILSMQSEIIIRYGGNIDKYTGDGVMAYWNTQGLEASKMASDLYHTVSHILAGIDQLSIELGHTFDVGIGVECGDVAIGDIGGGNLYNFTLMGNVVNTAARIENITKEYPARFLCSEDVVRYCTRREAVSADIFDYVDSVSLKGKQHKINLYTFRDVLLQ